MSRFIALLSILALSACGGPRAGAVSESLQGFHAPVGLSVRDEAPSLDGDPDLARDRRALAVRTAVACADRSAAAPQACAADEGRLLAEVFGPLALDAAPGAEEDAPEGPRRSCDGGPDGDAWLDAARPRVGRPRGGDLAVFAEAPGVPRTAVVVQVAPDGLVEAVAFTRGAPRRIWIHTREPDARRSGGRIVNTFLRVRRPDDPPRARYLAGQLLTGYRTLLD